MNQDVPAQRVRIVRIVTFHVAENEKEVVSFYEDAFRDAGMQPDNGAGLRLPQRR